MPRAKRKVYEGGWYHVMNRGAAHRYIFVSDELKEMFIEVLVYVAEHYKFEIHSFVIMGNHYHILIHLKEANLSKGMALLNSRFAREYNRRRLKDGPIFKDRFRSIHITTPAYLKTVIRYIHNNPVEAALVQFPEDYYWSSYYDYVCENRRFRFVKTDLFDSTTQFLRFSERGIDKKTSRIFNKAHWPESI
jgi:putative transposase